MRNMYDDFDGTFCKNTLKRTELAALKINLIIIETEGEAALQ